MIPGAGFQIRRNTIANNRGSGIVLQAPGGVVANNMITSPKYWGIQVSIVVHSRALIVIRCPLDSVEESSSSKPSRHEHDRGFTPAVDAKSDGSKRGTLL